MIDNSRINRIVVDLQELEKQVQVARNEYNRRINALGIKICAKHAELRSATTPRRVANPINITSDAFAELSYVHPQPVHQVPTIKQCKFMLPDDKQCPNHIPNWQVADFCESHKKILAEKYQARNQQIDSLTQGLTPWLISVPGPHDHDALT